MSNTTTVPLFVPTVKRVLSADQTAAIISCCGMCGPNAVLLAVLVDESHKNRKSDAAGRTAKVASAPAVLIQEAFTVKNAGYSTSATHLAGTTSGHERPVHVWLRQISRWEFPS